LVAAGVLALLVIQATMPDAGDVALAVAVGGALAVTIAGIVRSGPWFTAVVARGVARIGRGPSSLLAARRLEDDPAAGFRAISGVVLAVFVGTVFSSFAASELAMMETASDGLAPGVVAVHRDDPIDGEVVHRLGEQVAGRS